MAVDRLDAAEFSRDVAAVTFDFWDTLMYVEGEALRDGRLSVVVEVLAASGVDVELAALRAAHLVAFRRYQRCWRDNRQFCVPDAVDAIVHELAIPAAVDRDDLIEAFSVGGHRTDVKPAPGIADVLARLDDAGMAIGLVCDVGLTPSSVLLGHLERHELLRHFDGWSFSDQVGVYKPHPRIFEHALAGLGGVHPERAVHVGDRRRTDVRGATAFGMRAVRYAGIFDDREAEEPDADLVVTDHSSLAAALGCG